jgi:hypothetical protein
MDLKAIQVSLGFERAHTKVWDFFREQGMLIAFGKKAKFLTEGSKVIAYAPKSQGGRGVVGIGTVSSAAVTFFSDSKFTDDALAAKYRSLLRDIYSDPSNKPVKPLRCFNKSFKNHRRRLEAEGRQQMTSWEYSQRWLSDAKFIASMKKATPYKSSTAVRIPVSWEATVDYDSGFFSVDWAAAGVDKFQLPSLSSISPRKLSSKHWDIIRARLQTSTSSGSSSPSCAKRRAGGKRPSSSLASSSAAPKAVRPAGAGARAVPTTTGPALSADSIEDFLASLGLEKYAPQFHAEEVDVAAARLLSDADLQSLGLPLGPRRKLQAALGA